MVESAQVGDLIRIVIDSYLLVGIGDIFEVVESGVNGAYVILANGDRYFIHKDDYVIHRKAGEEDEKPCEGESSISEQYTEIIERRKQASEDAVNHPDHYTQGRFETIEIIEEITQGYSDGYVAYCVGNALKYLARAPFKHESPSEDIAKARAYLDFAIKRLG